MRHPFATLPLWAAIILAPVAVALLVAGYVTAILVGIALLPFVAAFRAVVSLAYRREVTA